MFRWTTAVLLVVLAAVCGVALAGSLDQSTAHAGGRPLRAFTAGPLERIRAGAPLREVAPERLTAARGETESFQIAVMGPAQGVRAFPSALTTGGGARIERSSVTLYREHAVLVERSTSYPGGSNPPDPPGAIPDALIPFSAPGGRLRAQPFDVPATGNAVLFVDVTVPRSAAPGVYAGSIAIRAPGRPPLDVPFQLRVWSFALPVRPTLGSFFGIWKVARRQASALLLRNRLQPGTVHPADAPALRPLGLTAAGLGFWSGANARTCSFARAPAPSALRRAAASLGAGLRLYDYSADETDACPGTTAGLRAWGRALHASGVDQLATATPSRALLDDGTGRPAVDIWVLGPDMTAKAAPYLPAVRAAGGEIWLYTALVPDAAAPTWTTDEPLVNDRILPGFLAHALGATGILYWRIDGFGDGNPWNAAPQIQAGGASYPGDGQLVYPGAEVGIDGVVPSLRLKAIRDGEEDYELLRLAQSRLGPEAREIAARVATGWSTWSHDPAVLAAARLRIGNLLAVAQRSGS